MKTKIHNVIYIVRHTPTFSIEKVFYTIEQKLRNVVNISYLRAITPFEKPISVIKNLLYFYYNIFKEDNINNIYHVTGVLHYLFLVLPYNNSILTIHDCIKYHQHSGIKRLIIKYIWFVAPIKYFKYITTISSKTKKELIEITSCNPDKIRVIYNPITLPLSYKPKVFNEKTPNILHIGTLPNKNLENLITSLKDIKCTLTIVGLIDNSIIKLLKQYDISYSNLSDISDYDLIKLYESCDIVSFITLYEGFGLPILEGQSIGRVVITSSINPHQEIGGKGAYFVNPLDIDDITNGFKELIDNKSLRNQLIEDGLRNTTKFSSEVIAEQYRQLYEQVIFDSQNKN